MVPRTSLGKWSVGLIVSFFLLLATGMFMVAVFKQTGGETFFDNPMISIPMLGAGVSGILAFITGAVAIVKNKERSILVITSTLVGFLVLDFVLGELLSPH